MYKVFIFIVFVLFLTFFGWLSARAQASGFTYQGSLKDGAAAANGNYDITVEIYDAETGGNLLGTANFTSVPVVDGIFTVNIGTNPSLFPGAARYLQLKVGRSGTASFTILSPRQLVSSTPYALKSLTADNALNLGGVSASQFVQTNDSRLTDARNPLSGSTSYIQNGTNQQSASNFNISGNGVLGGRLGIGTANPQFALHVLGQTVRVESPNGSIAPQFSLNFTGGGTDQKKWQNYAAENTLAFTALNDAENAETSWLRVVRGTGTNIKTVSFPNGNVSIGTFYSDFKLRVEDPGNAGLRVGTSTTGGTVASFGPYGTFEIDKPGVPGGRLLIRENGEFLFDGGRIVITATGDVGIGTAIPGAKLDVQRGFTRLELDSGGSQSLCRNSVGNISVCSSSRRYKTNIDDFKSGLSLLKRLRPVTFDWKAGGMHDLGLVAEEVAEVEPLLATYNDKGETEGVKYDRVGVVLVNAVQEQQAQIEALKKENEELKTRLDALEKLIRQPVETQKEN